MDKLFTITVLVLLIFCAPAMAQNDNVGASLRYTLCSAPDTSNACFIGYHKMRSQINPMNNKRYFDDGIHYLENGQLFMYPEFAVAQPDLDGDGFKEIIVVPKEQDTTLGTFCQEKGRCPHFILQDRNVPGQRPSLRNFKILAKIYTNGIGLSTDEVVGGYRSLRAYHDGTITKFDVYQYDRRNDEYFNISAR